MSKKIIVKSKIRDLIAFTKLVSLRRKKIMKASPEKSEEDSFDKVVRTMHPKRMFLKIAEVKDQTESTKTFTLVPDIAKGTKQLATFRPGQYLNIQFVIEDIKISRNYSLSSTPKDASNGLYMVTVRKKEKGFVTSHIFKTWKKGTLVESSGPMGNFVYEPLRDKQNIIAIAGGCGITPIFSLLKDSIEKQDNRFFTILYGVKNSKDIIFKDELSEIAEKFKTKVNLNFVASEPEEQWKGPIGFITAELIEKLSNGIQDKSFFICGPQAMYTFLDKEIEKLSIPHRLVRKELFGEVNDPLDIPGFPLSNVDKIFTVKVHIADEIREVQALGKETVLISLEKAGLAPPSRCRSGECGFCRSKLITGEIFVSNINDGRRIADKKFNWFHPCSSYPLSDLEIRISRAL